MSKHRTADGEVIFVAGNKVIVDTPTASNGKEVEMTIRGLDVEQIKVGDQMYFKHTSTGPTPVVKPEPVAVVTDDFGSVVGTPVEIAPEEPEPVKADKPKKKRK